MLKNTIDYNGRRSSERERPHRRKKRQGCSWDAVRKATASNENQHLRLTGPSLKTITLGGLDMNTDNRDRQQEEKRLARISKIIEHKTNRLKRSSGNIKDEVIHIRKTFWEDVTVNMDNMEDAVETLASIKQQSELLSERERAQNQLSKQLKTLDLLKDSPYFGRIDFHEDGEKQTDTIYIGIASLMDQNNENFLIYDWRAPISSLYYDYSPGPAEYLTLEGVITGNMKLKRQFIIKNGTLKSMFDTGITIGDELLKEVLGTHADNHMKNIVATIQKEQNKIIRNEQSKYLVVQGVAGSGKTSAALQRVAFLLYRHIGTLKSNQILLFSPNPLFNSYIATVLPNLGEENMQQITFQDYIEKYVGNEFVIEDSFQQMEYVLKEEKDEDGQARLEGIRFKAGLQYKRMMDAYIDHLSRQDLKFKSIRFRGETLISSSDIEEYFYSLDTGIPIYVRMQTVKEWLLRELSKKEEKEYQKEWVEDEIELLETDEYTETYLEIQEKQHFSEDTFSDFDQEKAALAKKLVRTYFNPIKKAIKKLKFIHIKAIYMNFFMDGYTYLEEFNYPELWSQICEYTLTRCRLNELSNEDATAYIYLKAQLEGRKTNNVIRHLFIDEAQDYSPFQLAVLKQLFPVCKMTILGDLNQAIHAHSLNAPTLLSDELYDAEKFEKMELTKSYRSTRQIVEFTKEILGNLQIEPFNRTGPKPTVRKVENDIQHIDKIKNLIANLEKAGHQTIAIICKTEEETRNTYAKLSSHLDVQLMKKTTYSYNKGVLVLPSYLSKGIEFDAVIIYDASQGCYHRELERKLFYTACTRAMHELHLFSKGELSPFIKLISQDLYLVE